MSDKKTVLWLDTSLGIDHVLRYAKDSGEKPFYYMASISAYPNMNDSISGYGFDEIIKTYDWSGILKKVDTVVFLDSGFSSLVDSLRAAKYNVWGAPAEVEKLEFDRIFFREKFKELGIPTTEATVVQGVTAVIDFLTKNKGKYYIKLNKYRGNIETFGAMSPIGAKLLLDQAGFGIMGEEVKFVLEHEAEGMEVGADAWFNGKRFLKKYFFTVEQKGSGNMGLFVNHSILDSFMEKITPYLAENNYHGSFCFEGFWDGKEFKATDITPRIPYPCSGQWALAIKDYDKFFRGIADGSIDDFEVNCPYQIQMNFFANDPKKWRQIEIDEKGMNEDKQKIGFRKILKTEEGYFFVPEDDLMLTCNGSGKDWEEAIKMSLDCTEHVHAYSASPSTGLETIFADALKDMEKHKIELIPANVKIEKAEIDVRAKLEEVEARLVNKETPSGIPMIQEKNDACACEQSEADESGLCKTCGKKKIFAEVQPGQPVTTPGIPHAKETCDTIQ